MAREFLSGLLTYGAVVTLKTAAKTPWWEIMALAFSMYCDSHNWDPKSCTCVESLEEILAPVGHGTSTPRWTVPTDVDPTSSHLTCHLRRAAVTIRTAVRTPSEEEDRMDVPCRLAVFYLVPLDLNDKCGRFGS